MTDTAGRKTIPPDRKLRKPLEFIFYMGIVVHVLTIFVLSAVPPISRDALIHHLAIPKMYLAHGGMYEIPSMHFSYFPMNLDLLYLLPLYFNSDISAKYIHFLFALLTAGMIYWYLRDKLDHISGLIGALLFLTIPVIIKLSVTVYVDLGLIFFSFACLYFFLKWHDTQFETRYLSFAAVSCGLALGTKYNGLILLIIMSAMVPVSYAWKKNKFAAKNDLRLRYGNSMKGLLWSGVFMLVALVVFSPWMVRNTIWKQNPVYPLFKKVFNPPPKQQQSDLQKKKSPPKNAFWMRRYVYKESFAQTLSIPVRMFFQGRDNDPKYFDGKLTPFLLLLPLLSFVRLRGSPLASLSFHQVIFAIFAILFSLFVFFRVDFRIRYISPAVPPLVILSVFGIRNMAHFFSQRDVAVKQIGRVGIAGVVLIMFGLNAFYIYGQFAYIQPLKFLTRKVDRDSYITYFRKEYPVIRHANQTLPEDARVLCLSIGDRTYYLNREAHLAEDFFNPKKGGFTEGLLLDRLMRYGTTHIIMDRSVAMNWIRNLPQGDRSAFENVFRNHTKLLYSKFDVLLLELHRSG